MLYYIAMPLCWLLARLLFRVEYIGRENLRRVTAAGRGFILAPNHVCAIDPVFVVVSSWYFLAHKMRIFAKKELYQINALLTWFFVQMGAVSVKNGRDDLDTLDRTVAEVKAGRGLLLFPEGTRTKTGALLPPKSGAFVVAAQAGVDMLPCRILYDTDSGRARLFCRVRVCFGEVISAEALAMEGGRDIRRLKENKKLLTARWEALGQANCFPGRVLPAAPEKKPAASAAAPKEE